MKLATLSILSLAGASAFGNLFSNGSFEDGAFSPDSIGYDVLTAGSTAITGWTVTGGNTLAWGKNGNTDGLTASDGKFFLDLTGYTNVPPYAGVKQTIATVAGQKYTLSGDLGISSLFGSTVGPISVDVDFGGQHSVWGNSSTGPGNVWVTNTSTFTATTSSTVVTFTGLSGGSYIGLDNVSAATPEPGTVIALTAGLGALLRKRKKA